MVQAAQESWKEVTGRRKAEGQGQDWDVEVDGEKQQGWEEAQGTPG